MSISISPTRSGAAAAVGCAVPARAADEPARGGAGGQRGAEGRQQGAVTAPVSGVREMAGLVTERRHKPATQTTYVSIYLQHRVRASTHPGHTARPPARAPGARPGARNCARATLLSTMLNEPPNSKSVWNCPSCFPMSSRPYFSLNACPSRLSFLPHTNRSSMCIESVSV